MENKNFGLLKEKMDELRNNFSSLKNQPEYILFTAVCIKYFFYGSGGNKFDGDVTQNENLVDGSNDGGFDAILNDPDSLDNDLIFVQSKFYTSETSKIKIEDIAKEAIKMSESLDKLSNGKVTGFNKKTITAYRNAIQTKGDDAQSIFYFFTSVSANNKKERRELEKTLSKYFDRFDEIKVNYLEDIIAEIEIVENGKLLIDKDQVEIDKRGNLLRYGDSIVVNVSAKSLQDLQTRRRNGLLGMNLRYHIKNKKIDNAIKNTIENDAQNFWYKNNGIVILCESYDEPDGNIIRLYNFSIVNGGQTTTIIGTTDLPEEDFYIQTKIIPQIGHSAEEKEKFVLKIAESTNSQKPIKTKDLKANQPEQNRLKEKLKQIGVYYITKNGDRAPAKKYDLPYLQTNIEKVGKLSMAGILLMPGSARNKLERMYSDEYYYKIFGEKSSEQIIKDLLKIDFYYDQFLKSDLSIYSTEYELPMLKNGKTFVVSCLSFLIKLVNHEFEWQEVVSKINDVDELKQILFKINKTNRLIAKRFDDERERMFSLFQSIINSVMAPRFEISKEKMKEQNKDLAPSNYLKDDNTFYKEILQKLYSFYQSNNEFKSSFNGLFLD